MKIQNSKFRPLDCKKGFSLGEMFLVVITIGVLFSIAFNIYDDQRKRFLVNDALAQSLQIFKEARNKTITSDTFHESSLGGTEDNQNIVPRDGFGVRVLIDPNSDNDELQLFVNRGLGPTRLLYQAEDTTANQNAWDLNDPILDTVTFPIHLTLKSMSINGVEQYNPTTPIATMKEANIMFRPTLGDAEMYDESGTIANSVQLNFRLEENPVGSAKRCALIHIKRTSSAPELTYQATGCEIGEPLI